MSCCHSLALPYDSPCNNLHGHNYIVEVGVEGTGLHNGMVMDFKSLKKIFMEKIHNAYDHQDLNNIFPFSEIKPTAENMASVFYDIIQKELFDLTLGLKVYGIRIHETSNSWVEYIQD